MIRGWMGMTCERGLGKRNGMQSGHGLEFEDCCHSRGIRADLAALRMMNHLTDSNSSIERISIVFQTKKSHETHLRRCEAIRTRDVAKLFEPAKAVTADSTQCTNLKSTDKSLVPDHMFVRFYIEIYHHS